MKIGELDQHCGNCSIIDYCSEPFSSLCLCTDKRLCECDTDTYIKLAKEVNGQGMTGEQYKEAVADHVAKAFKEGQDENYNRDK